MDKRETNIEDYENTITEDELEEPEKTKEDREEYVFPHDETGQFRIRIAACVILIGIFFYFLCISIEVVRYSGSHFMQGILGMVLSVAVIVFNIFLIYTSQKQLRFCRRYDLYMDLLKNREMIGITELEECSGQDRERIVKDLDLAVKQKLIPQGHFDNENDLFIAFDLIN